MFLGETEAEVKSSVYCTLSSTIKPSKAKTSLSHLLTRSNSYTQLAIPLHRLIEGFVLSCKVENKSPKTISFYKNNLDKFVWFLNKFGIDTIDATTIRSFLGYLKDCPHRWDSKNYHANIYRQHILFRLPVDMITGNERDSNGIGWPISLTERKSSYAVLLLTLSLWQ